MLACLPTLPLPPLEETADLFRDKLNDTDFAREPINHLLAM